MTIKEVLIKYSNILKEKGFKSADLDCEILLTKILNVEKIYFITNSEKILSNIEIDKFLKLFKRRLKHEPIAYILNNKNFCDLDFYVDKNVLIPRPLTESLIDIVINKIIEIDKKHSYVIDIGTGSGVIIISLINKIFNQYYGKFLGDNYYFYASDKSKNALNVAKKNAYKFGFDDKIKFLEGDLKFPDGVIFDYIIANLPYVDKKQVDFNNDDSKDIKFEPKIALFEKDKGFYLIDKLIKKILKNNNLNRGGYLFLEMENYQLDILKEKYSSFFDIKYHFDGKIVEMKKTC